MTSVNEFKKVYCPTCYAHPNEPCTAPTIGGRVDVRWVHLTRENEFYENGHRINAR